MHPNGHGREIALEFVHYICGPSLECQSLSLNVIASQVLMSNCVVNCWNIQCV